MHIEAEFACAEWAQNLTSPLGESKVRVTVVDQDWSKAITLAAEVFPLHPIVAGRRFSLLM